MANRVKTYIPAPNWDIPADSDLVVLGRLIKDPNDPETKVPGSEHVPIPLPRVYEGDKQNWYTVSEQLRSGSIGLWAKCLQFIGGGLTFRQLRASVDVHRFEVLETRYFVPDEEYFSRVLDDAGVQAYFEVHDRRKPVYLITGIKTARVASAATHNMAERVVGVELKADAASVGVPVEVGPEMGADKKQTTGTIFGGTTDYIFAYRMTQIKPRKNEAAAAANKAYVKGAVFGNEGKKDQSGSELDQYEIDETELGFMDCLDTVEDG